jgi:hypothetical protein
MTCNHSESLKQILALEVRGGAVSVGVWVLY